MEGKLQPKEDKNQKDLDQKINTFYIQKELEREKALLDLIVKVIVKATLKEHHEIMDNIKNE